MHLKQKTEIRLGKDDIVQLDWIVPSWKELAIAPAARGFVRHGGVRRSEDSVGKELKWPYADQAAAYLAQHGDAAGVTPRTLLVWGSRNTLQNLGLPGWHRDRRPRLLGRLDEPWRHWTYHALCRLRDGGCALLRVRFEPADQGETALVVAEPSRVPAETIVWAVTGQPLIWDGVVSSLTTLAAATYDLRHLWRLRWEDWQACPEEYAIHTEMMHLLMQHLTASAETRGTALVKRAEQYALPITSGYLHSSLGRTPAGDMNLLLQTGSLAEIGESHRSMGSDRAILLDNGGSVGIAYWSQYQWRREGWNNCRNRPCYLGNGSYFRPRGHSVLVAELTSDLPDGPTSVP